MQKHSLNLCAKRYSLCSPCSSWCSCSFRTPHLLCTGRWTALKCRGLYTLWAAEAKPGCVVRKRTLKRPTCTRPASHARIPGSETSLHPGTSRSSHVHREQCLGLLTHEHHAIAFHAGNWSSCRICFIHLFAAKKPSARIFLPASQLKQSL